MNNWHTLPRTAPRKCALTGESKEGSDKDSHRYFEADFTYFDVGDPEAGVPGSGARHQLYISTAGMRLMAEAPGSPLRVMTVEDEANYQAAIAERDELKAQLAAADSGDDCVCGTVDVDALAAAVAERLNDKPKPVVTPPSKNGAAKPKGRGVQAKAKTKGKK